MLWFSSWFACVHETPPELRLESTRAEGPVPEPADATERMTWVLRGDPLARRPRIPEGEVDADVDAWRQVARRQDPRSDDWWSVEATRRGTIAVPLARGARLAAIEPRFPDFGPSIAWIVPLPMPTVRVEAARPALDWLSPSKPEDVLTVMERQVLLGWLDGPAIPISLVARPLQDATWARLTQTPTGALILARAQASGTGSADALLEATRLALMEVAADSDAEQTAWRSLRGDGPDPINTRLGMVGQDGRDAAGVGRSLLGLAALRWRDACPDTPCGGLDRVDSMTAAGRWAPELGPFVQAWQVIALKDAIDQLLTTYDTGFARLGVDRVVEALVGIGVTGVDFGALQHRDPGPGMHLAITRALGGGDATSKEAMFSALHRELATRAEAARAVAPEGFVEPLKRIAVRAKRDAGP